MKKNIFFLTILCTVSLTSLAPITSSAHSSGQSLEQAISDYIIDIGYDSYEKNPVAGTPIKFDFNIFHGSEVVDFNNIRVTFSHDTQLTGFADIRKSSFGNTSLIYTFPKAGAYKLKVDFRNKDEKTITQHTFDLQIDRFKDGSWKLFLGGIIFGLALAGLLLLVKKRWRKK